MRRIAWLTDLHLNFVPPALASQFIESVGELPVDVVLIGGDISDSSRLILDLSEFSARVRKPVFFVLGNNDYYRGSIRAIRSQVSLLCSRMPNLWWLSEQLVVQLTAKTALVGHDGWGDGTLGVTEEAVSLNDELQIEELNSFDRRTLFARLRELGEQAASHIRLVLPQALEHYEHVCLLTHVPPFRESCWHEGQVSDDRFLPRFACGQLGAAIVEIMSARPDRQLTVLCGHTHVGGFAQILPNVQVWSASVEYGRPAVQRLFWVP